jgi:anti-sigma B factor antagonist/stage II sporulation protein AA (anti-sigma F factor antagonist)
LATQITENGEVLMVRLEERLDAASSPMVERKINTFIEAGHRKLLLNFASVGYLSSAGMRVLLTLSKKLHGLQGKMVICEVKEEVMEVVRMAGFDRILDILPNEMEALRALSA